MIKRIIFAILLLFIFGCTQVKWAIYDPPVPTVKAHKICCTIYFMEWDKFREHAKYYFGENGSMGVVGFTLMGKSPRLVFLPIREGGTIDLETLGHEIFYHVIYSVHH